MLKDIEISQQSKMKEIKSVANEIGILDDELLSYGKYNLAGSLS